MISAKARWSLLLAALLFSLAAFAAPPDDGMLGKCSLATLKGTYGGVEQGTLTTQLPELPPPPYATVQTRTVTYDGAGHLSFAFTANRSGTVSSGEGTGTYSVGADCSYLDDLALTGDMSSFISAHYAAFVSGGGMSQRIDTISVGPMVSSGTLKKMSEGGCSLATLKGTFRGITQGDSIRSGFPLPSPFFGVMAQSVFLDGAGNATVSAFLNFAGVVRQIFPVGTYMVSHDCTYSDSFGHVGTITGTGDTQEVNYIFTTTTDVAVGIIQRYPPGLYKQD